MRPFHILLVDNDDLAILNMQRALERAGYDATITAAADGIQALQLLRGGTLPEGRLLVLTDVNMPGLSGIGLLDEIRNDRALADLPVVILTASTLDADRVAAFSHHVAGYFVKPATPTHYKDVIHWLHAYWGRSEFSRPGALGGA